MMAEHFLTVLLHGQSIGTLTLLAGDRNLFAFNDGYISDLERPTLSLSFKALMGELVIDVKQTRTRLPPFFSNLLPEGPMRKYLAKRANVNENREFFLLRVLGNDLPGAVRVEKPGSHDILLQENEDKKGLEDKPNGPLHFSLAGVQLKFSAVMETTGGLTVPASGSGGSWIVKLPSTSFEAVPENEFAMMRLAGMIGINVPDVKLIPINEISGLPDDMRVLKGNALAIRRFDREENGSAVHIEDFAQVFGVYPEKKYDRASYRNIAEVILAESGLADIAEFVRRLVFNTLIGNADMHLKNWSLIYPDCRQAALAPAYDLLSTIPYIKDSNTALKLVKSRDMAGLSSDRLSHFAAKARLPQKIVIDAAKETVERFRQTWRNGKYLDDLPLVRDAVKDHLKTINLVKDLS
jgi:serine/threonine-protein kinase HipA